MNERLRILQLLEDGKINAEEAARLLEALAQSESEKKTRSTVWSSLENIPGIIATAIEGSFKDVVSKETQEFPAKKRIEFKGISGDLEIAGSPTDAIRIEKDGLARIVEQDDALVVKAISGDLDIRVPVTTDFVIKGVSGDMRISHLDCMLEIASVSGTIEGRQLSGSFIGDFVSGDVDLEYERVKRIRIKSKSGDITIRLQENIETELLAKTRHGEINCEFALKNEQKTKGLLKGIINNAKAQIEIENEHGDITIKKRT